METTVCLAVFVMLLPDMGQMFGRKRIQKMIREDKDIAKI